MIIPKEITEKIRKANDLNNEVCKWLDENTEIEGYDFTPLFWDIVPEPQGEEQIEAEEYCEQRKRSENWYTGEYYYKLEGESNYLRIDYEIW